MSSTSSASPSTQGRPQPAPPAAPQQAGAQTLITAVNDPRVDARATWWKRGELGGPWGAGDPVLPPLDPYKYPNYKAKDLESYLKIIRISHKQFLRDRESLAASSHRLPEHSFISQQQQQQQQAHAGEESTRPSQKGPGHKEAALGDGLAQALLHVPAHFFSDDFTVEGSGLFQGADTPEELQARIELLSSYLDVVEVQLMREVQLRSSSIFDAASEVDALNQLLCGALSRIKSLRQHLSEVDDQTYASACHVAALQQRRNNVSATLDVLQVVEEVASSRVALQLLLDGQDYAGALDLLEVVAHNMEANCGLGLQMFAQALPQMQETRELLESLLACEFVGLANFSQAHAVMEAAIAQAAQANTLAAKQEAGEEESCPGPLPEEDGALMAGMVGSAEAEAAVREQLHDKLLPVVLALLRVDRLSGAMQQLHDNYAASTKALIREVLERALNPTGSLQMLQQAGSEGGSADGVGPGSGGDFSVVQALQGLSHEGFLQVLSVVFKVVAACLAHLSQLSSIVRDDILRAAKVPAPATNQVSKDIRAVLQVVADVAQGRWGKLVSARSHCTPRLKLYEFQALAAICTSFAALLEPHSPRAAAAVRLVALAQCRSYVEALHTRSVAQLQHLLEAEQWTATEVPPTFQDIVNRLMERCSGSGTHGGGTAQQSLTSEVNGGTPINGIGTPAGALKQQQQQQQQQPARPGGLMLNGKRFLLVNTTLMLFKLLDEYLSVADSSPLYCVELGQHVVDLIRLFNNQSCQLVLGAGAVRTAGLRSISAKHLALSCESCYMLAQLIPTLRTVFLAPPPASPLPSQQPLQQQQQQQQQLVQSKGGSKPGFAGFEPQRHMLMLEFDKLANDLTVHTREVHSKLVEIMQDRLLLAARQLATESRTWGAVQQPQQQPSKQQLPQPTKQGFEVSPAVRSLSKQLGTLQSVLVPILQEEEVHYIFGRVASLYCDTLAATLDVLKPPTPEAATAAQQQQQQQQQQPTNVVISVDAGVWEECRRLNTLYALQSFRVLPLEPSQSATYLTRLSTFYIKHYGALPSPQAAAGSMAAAAAPAPPPAAAPAAAQATKPTSTATSAAAAAAEPPPAPTSSPSTASAAAVPAPPSAPAPVSEAPPTANSLPPNTDANVEASGASPAPAPPSPSRVSNGVACNSDSKAASPVASTAASSGPEGATQHDHPAKATDSGPALPPLASSPPAQQALSAPAQPALPATVAAAAGAAEGSAPHHSDPLPTLTPSQPAPAAAPTRVSQPRVNAAVKDAASGTSCPSDLAATHPPVPSPPDTEATQGPVSLNPGLAATLAPPPSIPPREGLPDAPPQSAQQSAGHGQLQQAWPPCPSPSAANQSDPGAAPDGGMHSANDHHVHQPNTAVSSNGGAHSVGGQQAQQLSTHNAAVSPEQEGVAGTTSSLKRTQDSSLSFPPAPGPQQEATAAPALAPTASAAESLGGPFPQAGSLSSPSASTAESLGGLKPTADHTALSPSASAAESLGALKTTADHTTLSPTASAAESLGGLKPMPDHTALSPSASAAESLGGLKPMPDHTALSPSASAAADSPSGFKPTAGQGLSPSTSAADSLGGPDLLVQEGGRDSGFPSCEDELQRGSSLSPSSGSASTGNLDRLGASASLSLAASPSPDELRAHSSLPATAIGASSTPSESLNVHGLGPQEGDVQPRKQQGPQHKQQQQQQQQEDHPLS